MISIRSLLVAALAGYATAFPTYNPFSAVEPTLKKRAGGSCSDANFAAPVGAGDGTVGTAFCESDYGTSYTPIVTVNVWAGVQYVSGIQVVYSDGTASPVYGLVANYTGASISVNYALGDRFTELDMFTNGQTVGHIYIKASNGQELNAGATTTNEVSQPVGGGILFGMQGTASNAVNSLSFLFLGAPIKSIAVTNLAFPDGPSGDQDLHPEQLAIGHFYNNQDTQNSTWTFSDSRAIATAQTFTQMTTNTYGTMEAIQFSISGGFLGIVTVMGGSTTTFTWTTAYATTTTNTVTDTVTVTWSEMGTLAPKTGIDAVALVSHGKGTYSYTSTVTITLTNGQSFSFPENGSVTVDDVSGAIVTVTDNNTPA